MRIGWFRLSLLHRSEFMFCAVLFCGTGARAQQAPPAEPPQALPSTHPDQPTIRVNAKEVLVPTLVEKADGDVVYGLKPSDFTLTDNGVPQKIRVQEDLDTAPVALVVAVVLAVVALVQRDTAVSNEQLAMSRQIAADAQTYLTSDPDLSTVLAIKSIGVRDTQQGESALRSALPELQILRTWVAPGMADLDDASFSSNRSMVVTTSTNGTATIFEAATAGVAP